MVNYASNEFKNNNGVKYDISERIPYNSSMAKPFDLDSDTLDARIVKVTLPSGHYLHGVLINGFLCGPCKIYDKEDKLECEGIFVGNSLCGPGKKYREGNIEFEGTFVNNEYSGYGETYNADNQPIYKGNFANGEYNGYGVLYENVTHENIFAKSESDRYGTLSVDLDEHYHEGIQFEEHSEYISDPIYEGEFANGKFNGEGIFRSDENIYYDGEFSNGRIHGKGEFIDFKGNKYKGNFISDTMYGHCQKITKDGDIIEGDFSANRSVNDITILSLGNQISLAVYEPHGPVKVYPNGDLEGDYYTTYYAKGKSTGKTYFYDSNHNLKSIIEFDYKGSPIKGIEYKPDERGIKRREFKIEKSEKIYISTEDSDDDCWTYEISIYWDILSNTLDNNKPIYLDRLQSYQLMIDALKNKAHSEVDICCPWMNYEAMSWGAISAIKDALKRGIDVKIITGLGHDKDKDTRYEDTEKIKEYMEREFKGYKGKLSIKVENNHEKMLLCDNDFMIYGSDNLLSCHPYSDAWTDSMRYFTNPNEIHETRKKYFNF